MKKLKFYNPYIQTLCLIIGIFGISNVNFFVSLINIPRLYWQLFFALFILLFFLRKVASPDTRIISKYRGLAEDIMNESISFLLLGFAWDFIIYFLCLATCSLSIDPMLAVQNSSLQWVIFPLNMIFIIVLGFWSFRVFKKIGISKASYYSFAVGYSFIVILDILLGINYRLPPTILYYVLFMIMLAIGILLLFVELINRHWEKSVSLRTCGAANGLDDTKQ